MHLDLSEDQDALARMTDRICFHHCPPKAVRLAENSPEGYPPELWAALRDAGLLGIRLDGGAGAPRLPMPDCAAIYETLGRYLAPTPHFASSVVCTSLLQRPEVRGDHCQLLGQIRDGDAIVVPAWLEQSGGFASIGICLRATANGNGYLLEGTKLHVPFAEAADRLLVIARTGNMASDVDLFLVDPATQGVSICRTQSLAGDHQATVFFDRAELEEDARLTFGGAGWFAWQAVLDEAQLLEAAYAIGLAGKALEITTAFAAERSQFGRPIASFQAISHPLVDATIAIEGARTLMFEAAWAHSEQESWRALAAMALYQCHKTARWVTARALQVHGGIGFTLDYDIQLFFRRAKQLQIGWSDPCQLRERIACLVLDEGEQPGGPDPLALDPQQIAALNQRHF